MSNGPYEILGFKGGVCEDIVVWDVMPCDVEIYWHFRGLWCLHNVCTWLPNYTAPLSDGRTLHHWKIFLYEYA
jgi:hypothetical protein